MHFINKITRNSMLLLMLALAIGGCQKMDRPELGDYPEDPPPPPYSTLKSFWEFENNIRDTGQYRIEGTVKNVTFGPGIKGQAAVLGADGYLMSTKFNDSLTKPGSLTVAWWMNAAAPTGNAKGIFAIAKKTEFWGNVEFFLETNNNGNEAFLKVHLFNATHADKGEEWNEIKIPNALNKWTHFAVVYSAADSKLSIYADGVATAINGKVLKGGNYGPLKFTDVAGIVLGNFAFETDPTLASHGAEPWASQVNGSIDQFRIYNVPLSATEVKALFDNKQ
ncbi:MAG: LamG domain-containing protein [Chitinophagaceae bacterium]|nr:LamG domain-containing protein [Chitinophagaceae bacterium]